MFRATAAILLAMCLPAITAADESLEYFEREVRPVLVDHCQKCHGPEKQESDLRLDSREGLLKGGVSGEAIVPGDPQKSLLIAAIRHEGDVKMPPKAKLTEAQIAAISRWIKLGAPWTKDGAATAARNDGRQHWAFQPVSDPAVPRSEGGAPEANPIDSFIRAKLAAAGLDFSPPADRRTLIRRLSYDLTGLPPTPEDVDAFLRDDSPKAFENLVDRLLSSPHYGEQWARHWLDVARYADTKGYVYAREQRTWLHAWVYRDWVVKALNEDLPYDRFLLLQIAADQAAPEGKASLAAMGFLTLGRRFLGVQREIIDDRIDVVTRGTMGLTVACARCHDHKYDPIPTKDYYSLYGVFQSCSERLEPIGAPPTKDEAYLAFEKELEVRRKKLADTLATRRAETSARVRARAGEYLAAQLELHKYPAEGFDQILEKTDLLPTFVRVWQTYLAEAHKQRDPVFAAWHAYAELPTKEFAAKAQAATTSLASEPAAELNPLVAAKFATAPASMSDVADRYGELFAEVDRQWQEAAKSTPPPLSLGDPAAEAIRQVLYAKDGPCEVPDEPIVNIEYFVDSESCNELWKLQNEVDNWILQSPVAPPQAAILVDRARPANPKVFKRGNPANPGDEVPRQFIEVIASSDRKPFETGSGRLELAKAIIDPKNPLTARVIVNRVWLHHFGAGLVRTPSDFGTRAEPPSHPELLDWLTSRFLEEGWSLKKLHRHILLSKAWQQSASGPSDATQAAKARQLDPENRLLWRASERRLSFEEMRDALLMATGELDVKVGGKPGDLFAAAFKRRTLYGSIDRQFFPSALRIFDAASPDLHTPQRSVTTVPQQALFFLNHPLMVGHAQALARRTAGAQSPEQRVEQMYRLAYQRSPTPEQREAALEMVRLAEGDKASSVSATALQWQYGFGKYDEATQRVSTFEKLPHFTGSAWQGGAAFPDAKLGWVQLTATGGHPGNDLDHAAVRRWTAPRDMTVRVTSRLVHEPKEGKGVHAFVVSSRQGLLRQAHVHNNTAELNVESVEVKTGDTLDFVAHIGDTLSHNQFLWSASIHPLEGDQPEWNSQRDFEGQAVQRLEPWEQLAQVLLSANELVFVD